MKYYRQAFTSLFFLSYMLFTSLQAVYAEPISLTLPDCIELALKNNPKIQIAEADKERAAWIVKEAKAYHGFSLDYNYMLGRTDQAPSWYNNTTAAYPLALAYNPLLHENIPVAIPYPAWNNTYTFYSHQLKLQIPLYTGGKIENSILLSKHASAATDLSISSTRQQLTLDVTTSYFNVLQMRNLSNVAQQSVDDLTAHLTNVENHYDAGTVALSDVLQTEVRLANARNNLIKAQNAAKITRFKLNKVIGITLQNDAELDDHFTYEPFTASLEDSIAIGLKNRPEMAQAKLKIAMANDKIKIAHADTLPTVGAAAIENIADTTPSSSKDRDNWTLALNVSLNVFDNGLSKAKKQQANNELIIAKQQARQLEDAITLEVSQAYLSVQEAAERIKNNQVAVNQSKRDYEMAKERYEAGIGTNLDVMDAEVAMTQAKTNYIQALYDYNNSRAQLDKTMGIIN